MAIQPSETLPRPSELRDHSDPAVLYALSYLVTRAVVGILGVLLPVVFVIGESSLSGSVQVRGSISAYYHTPMRDVFVAGLCVIGFFLITYLSGRTKTLDFRLSLLAGVAVLFVVFFPTKRPDLAADAPLCGAASMPQGCSPLQQQLGEPLVAGVHFAAAAIFILSLAWLCFVFADPKREKSPRMRTILRACGWVILAAVAWTVVGRLLDANIWKLTPLYVGEVVSVLAFGAAWLVKARDLRKAFGAPRGDRRTADDRQGERQPSESSG